jgi:hypothetical protein
VVGFKKFLLFQGARGSYLAKAQKYPTQKSASPKSTTNSFLFHPAKKPLKGFGLKVTLISRD